MVSLFKEGDIVWCINDDYRITCYHRPCRVVGYDSQGSLLLKTFEQYTSLEFDVNEKLFELVPVNKILKTGQLIIIKGLDRLVEFKEYKDRGYIEVIDNGLISEYYVDDIIFGEGFYI